MCATGERRDKYSVRVERHVGGEIVHLDVPHVDGAAHLRRGGGTLGIRVRGDSIRGGQHARPDRVREAVSSLVRVRVTVRVVGLG